MQIWRVPYKLQIRMAGGGERSPGQHVSDVIRDLALRGKILNKKFADNDTMSAERVELGIAWEERLAKHHPEICFHPGEVSVDDIAMTIDGASFLGADRSVFHPTGTDISKPPGCNIKDWDHALHEFKLTWKSSRRDLTAEWMWLTQQKSYLKGMSVASGTPWRTSFLHVFWVNGNYSRQDEDPESGPTYAIWGMQFSDLEIRENWDMIRAHRDRMVKPGPRMSLGSFEQQ